MMSKVSTMAWIHNTDYLMNVVVHGLKQNISNTDVRGVQLIYIIDPS